MKNVTCLQCGWVHFQVSRKHAEEEVERFNKYFDTLSKEEQEMFGGKKSSIVHFEKCFFCSGSYTNFRDSEFGDCPTGCTLSGIIDRND